MKITIGIPFHNAETCVCRCIDAVARCCVGFDYQIVLANDFSNDAALATVAQHIAALPQARIVHLKDRVGTSNPNLGAAVNLMLDLVRPEDDFYWNVESDVYPEPSALSAAIDAFTPDVSAVRGIAVEEDGSETLNQSYGRHRWWHLCCMLIRGEDARNKAIRIEEAPFRLWYADMDFGCCLTAVTGKQAVFARGMRYRHLYGQSTGQMPGGQWPGAPTYNEAQALAAQKWG